MVGQPVEISLHLGAARANRKPVLQLLSKAGETIGFAKIGINALTRELVTGERAALVKLSEARLTDDDRADECWPAAPGRTWRSWC